MVLFCLVALLRGRRRRQRRHDPGRGLDLRRRRDRKLLSGRPRLRAARSPRPQAQDALHWQVKAKVSGAAGERRWSRLSARDAAGRPLAGLAGDRAARASDRHARSTSSCVLDERAPGSSAGRSAPRWPASGIWSIELSRDGERACSAPRTASSCAEHAPCRSRSIFRSSSGATPTAPSHMDLAVEGIGCAGCIRKIEERAEAHSRRSSMRASTSPTAAWRVDWRDGDARGRRRDRARSNGSATTPIRSSRSAPRPTRRARRAG